MTAPGIPALNGREDVKSLPRKAEPMAGPTFKSSFTVTIEMTEDQHAAYAERYGVGFAGMEVTNRARQATANALDEAPWMQGFATFKVTKIQSAPRWHDNWIADGRDGDGNQILRYEPTGGLYKILPVEEC